MIDEEKKLTVTDENGNEKDYEIIFTFEKDNIKYVVFHDPEADEENHVDCFVSRYDDEGHLFELEDDAEWDMAQEMIDAFAADNEEEEEK